MRPAAGAGPDIQQPAQPAVLQVVAERRRRRWWRHLKSALPRPGIPLPAPPPDANYRGLVDLHTRYGSQGLDVLAFPCNQVRGRAGRAATHACRLRRERLVTSLDAAACCSCPQFGGQEPGSPNVIQAFARERYQVGGAGCQAGGAGCAARPRRASQQRWHATLARLPPRLRPGCVAKLAPMRAHPHPHQHAPATPPTQARFHLFAKVDVNGPAADPLFSWLKAHAPGGDSGDLGWNFVKVRWQGRWVQPAWFQTACLVGFKHARAARLSGSAGCAAAPPSRPPHPCLQFLVGRDGRVLKRYGWGARLGWAARVGVWRALCCARFGCARARAALRCAQLPPCASTAAPHHPPTSPHRHPPSCSVRRLQWSRDRAGCGGSAGAGRRRRRRALRPSWQLPRTASAI